MYKYQRQVETLFINDGWKPVSAVALLNILYLGVFCPVVSYFSFLCAIKKLGPTVSSAFLNLIPVVSVTAGYFILDERPFLIQYAGMVMIVLSLFELNRTQKPPGS